MYNGYTESAEKIAARKARILAGDKQPPKGEAMKHTKQTAGQLGGRATVAKYGRNHMQDIGARGAQVTWTRYQLMPYGQTEYAMTERATGKVIRIIGR